MSKHKHLFKQTGGGCSLRGECDITYECKCGVKFRLDTNLVGYWNLPQEFYQDKELSEIDKKQREEILKMITNTNN